MIWSYKKLSAIATCSLLLSPLLHAENITTLPADIAILPPQAKHLWQFQLTHKKTRKMSAQQLGNQTSKNDKYELFDASCAASAKVCTVIAGTNVGLSGESRLISYNTIDGGKHWSQPTTLTSPQSVGLYYARLFCDKQSGKNCSLTAYYGDINDFKKTIDVFFSTNDSGKAWANGTARTNHIQKLVCSDDVTNCFGTKFDGTTYIPVQSFSSGFSWQPITMLNNDKKNNPEALYNLATACNSAFDHCVGLDPSADISYENGVWNIKNIVDVFTKEGYSTYNRQQKKINFSEADGEVLNHLVSDGICDRATGLYCIFMVSIPSTPSTEFSQFSLITTDGGITWSWSPNALKKSTSSFSYNPESLSCDNQAQHCTLLETRLDQPYKTVSCTTDDGGITWSTPMIVSSVTEDSFGIKVQCSENGQNCIAFSDTVYIKNKLYFNTSSDGGKTWNPSQTIN